MKKSIVIIGAGMGGLAAGIYGQRSGFATEIFEAHHQPGGQCASWTRNGYVFDACLHYFGAGAPHTRVNAFWREVGAWPCEMAATKETVSAVDSDGTFFHDYYDTDALHSHLKRLAPDDAGLIDEYVGGIRRFRRDDPFGDLLAMQMGTVREKISSLPRLFPLIRYFPYSLGTFGARFKQPFLRKTFPLLHSSFPDFPLFLHLAKHAGPLQEDLAWPKGGSKTVAGNMAARYLKLGGTIHFRKKVVRILTDNERACGVELEDGARHTADFVVSNADGRKTILQMLSGRYVNRKILKYCEPKPDSEQFFSVHVFLGVKRDLSSHPSALILFLDKPEVIGGHACDHLYMQIYGFDSSMAPAGKGVIKVELITRPSYFSRLYEDKTAYRAEKDRIADQVIALLEKQFPGLREDIEVVDVPTLLTWERFMGGTGGCENYPNKSGEPNILSILLGLDQNYTLPGLKNFYFAGGWVTSAGSLFMNALSGKTVVQRICKQCGVKFNGIHEAHEEKPEVHGMIL